MRADFREHLEDFVPHTFAADLVDLRGQLADGSKRRLIDRVAEARGKAHSTKHAQLIFSEALMRTADRAYHAALKVFSALNIVQHLGRIGIEQQPVDGEVPALYVQTCILCKLHLVGMAAVRVSAVTAESSDLNMVIVASAVRIAPNRNQHHTELCAHSVRLREELHYLLRRSRRGDIKVGRLASQQQVTHAAAHQIGRVALSSQRAGNADGFLRFFRR